jgi:hypothetical protein
MAMSMAESTVKWGRVTEKQDRVLIVASGPSAKAIDWRSQKFPEGLCVMSVNATLRHLPCATHWFTLDLTPLNKEQMWEQRMRPVKFYAGAFEDYVRTEAWVTFLRRRTGNGPRNVCFGLSEDPEWISTGNSAYGALGLAYLMGAKKVALIGVDGTKRYWYSTAGGPQDLSIMRDLFASAVPQLKAKGIEVVNGSLESIVDCFDRCPPLEAIRWIES